MWKIEKLRETNVENLKKKISDENDPQQGVATGAARGVCPSFRPPYSERGMRINSIQLRKQNAKLSILEAREICVLHVREKFTNQINTACCDRTVQTCGFCGINVHLECPLPRPPRRCPRPYCR